MINNISTDTNNSLDFKNNHRDDKLPHSSASFDEEVEFEKSEGRFPIFSSPVSPNLKVHALGTNNGLLYSQKNIPNANPRNIPNRILGQCGQGHRSDQRKGSRRYTRSEHIETLAGKKYRVNGKGITINDLLSEGFVSHKRHAQITIKHCVKRNKLFTLDRSRPQKYYPVCLKSEIIKKNAHKEVTGVNHFRGSLLGSKQDTGQDPDSIILQTLEGYILPLLSKAPLQIHRMHFEVKIDAQDYTGIVLPAANQQNKGSKHEEIIGNTRVLYQLYPNGTIMAFTESSNNPHRLEDESDCSRLLAYFGQIRDRLIIFLNDKHEKIVPEIMQWRLTQCDINKDIKVGDWLQYSGLRIQVKHLDHLFRIYIKSMGPNTICRVEESCNSVNKPVIEAINDIFNPCEKLGRQFAGHDKKLNEIRNLLQELVNRTDGNETRGE